MPPLILVIFQNIVITFVDTSLRGDINLNGLYIIIVEDINNNPI